MRCLLLVIMLILLSLPYAHGQQQYSEAACILLHQQMQRFSHIPQSSSYRNAQREYDRFCRQPTPAVPVETQPRPAVEPTKVPEPVKSMPEPAKQESEPESTLAAPAKLQDAAAQANDAERHTATEVLSEQKTPALSQMEAAVQLPLPLPPMAELQQERSPDLLQRLLNNIPLIIANIFAFLLAIFLLTTWMGWNLPGFKGVFAEYRLNRLLRWKFKRGYHHFRKLKMLTAKDELVMIDHLVLSPFGIFVIMVKDYRGQIFGSETEANWMRQYLGTSKQFMNPLHQNFKHVEAVKNLLQLQGSDVAQNVHSVIAFSRLAQFKTELPAFVTYIDGVSSYLKGFDEPCFDDEQLGRFAALLSRASTDL